jgi:hypothetical protein
MNKNNIQLSIEPIEKFLLDTIYKYRIWGDDNTDRIIKNREIYLASPGIFKDGYNECKLK